MKIYFRQYCMKIELQNIEVDKNWTEIFVSFKLNVLPELVLYKKIF